jgi:hypothetical protein
VDEGMDNSINELMRRLKNEDELLIINVSGMGTDNANCYDSSLSEICKFF